MALEQLTLEESSEKKEVGVRRGDCFRKRQLAPWQSAKGGAEGRVQTRWSELTVLAKSLKRRGESEFPFSTLLSDERSPEGFFSSDGKKWGKK